MTNFKKRNRPVLSVYVTPVTSSYVGWELSNPVFTGTGERMSSKDILKCFDSLRATDKRVLLVGCADEIERTQNHDFINAAAEVRGMWMALGALRDYDVVTVRDSTWLECCTGQQLWNKKDNVKTLAVAEKYNPGVATHTKESFATCIGVAWLLSGSQLPHRPGATKRLWL